MMSVTITTGTLVTLVGMVVAIGIGIGGVLERREAERKRQKAEAKRLRREKWQNRKEAVVSKLMPWKRG
jgi:hypothetical protein